MKTTLSILFALALCAGTAFARGGGGCIEQGTPVLTPDGTRPIEELRQGDAVMAVRGGRVERACVMACSEVTPAEYVHIVLPVGVLTLTEEHPVAVGPCEFRFAGRIRAGDRIQVCDGMILKEEEVLSVSRTAAVRPAFNLLVDKTGTYIAGGVLLHNKGCFLPDAPIMLANGSMKPIAQVHPGDRVTAFQLDGSITRTAVRNVIICEAEGYITVSTPKITLNVTAEHPFYVGNGTFRTIGSLKAGDTIFVFDGSGLYEQKITEIRPVNAAVTVYNLQTDDPYTFFAAGIAVHNKGGGCFLPNTPVVLADGSTKPIAQIRPGDRVTAFQLDGSITRTAVRNVIICEAEGYITVSTPKITLNVTAEHPFYVGNGAFRTIGSLKAGDTIFAFDGSGLCEQQITELRQVNAAVTVYNLQTDDPYTFFAAGIAVHNKGGGGFHGSSGGHSGSGGSPVPVFIFVGIFVVVFFISKIKSARADEDLDYCYPRSKISPKADKTLKLLDFIAKQDQAFAPGSLREVARSTFVKLQECWQARSYDPMKPLMMPDLFAQHLGQIRSMVRNHEINVISGLSVDRIDLVNVRYTEKPDNREFTALMTATARDYYKDDRTGETLRGDDSPAQFQEFWTFQLCGGAWLLREVEQTRESDVLKDENFFAQFTDQQLEQVYGGAVDQTGPAGPWLDGETGGKAVRIERLLNFLHETDRLWNRQAMLNRAREIFGEVYMSWESCKLTDSTAGKLFPDVAEHLRAEQARWKAQGASIEYRNFCVRKVELILVRNYNDRTRDEYVTRISAHAQTRIQRNGTITRQDEYVMPFQDYWTFGRLDEQWKLKETLPPAGGEEALGQENVDEGSGPDQLRWFYSKKQTV